MNDLAFLINLLGFSPEFKNIVSRNKSAEIDQNTEKSSFCSFSDRIVQSID